MLVKGTSSLSVHKGHILLIQLGDIGDVVLTLPTLKALRQYFPGRRLFVCVREQARDLMEDIPLADEVLSIRKAFKGKTRWIAHQQTVLKTLVGNRFYLTIDLRTGTRGAVLTALSMARYRIGRFADPAGWWRNRVFTHLIRPENEKAQYAAEHNLNIIAPFGWSTSDIRPCLPVGGTRKKGALRLLTEAGVPENRPCIAVHPFSLWAYKEWRQDGVIALINRIKADYDVSVLITGAPYETERVTPILRGCRTRVYSLVGKTSIGDIPAILQSCRCFIGVDTAALHIAAAVGTPTLGIFGPSAPVNWAPRGESHGVVTRGFSCQPCRQKGCQDSETSRCLDELNAETVYGAVTEMFRKTGVSPL